MHHLTITRCGPNWSLALGGHTIGRYTTREAAEAAAALNGERLKRTGRAYTITVDDRRAARPA
jgi:hypothetical protein